MEGQTREGQISPLEMAGSVASGPRVLDWASLFHKGQRGKSFPGGGGLSVWVGLVFLPSSPVQLWTLDEWLFSLKRCLQ